MNERTNQTITITVGGYGRNIKRTVKGITVTHIGERNGTTYGTAIVNGSAHAVSRVQGDLWNTAG